MHGRGGAGEIVDLVHLDVEREADVVAHRLEVRFLEEMSDVVLAAREVVVDREHVVALRHQTFAEMRAEEAGATRYENALLFRGHVSSGRKGRAARRGRARRTGGRS